MVCLWGAGSVVTHALLCKASHVFVKPRVKGLLAWNFFFITFVAVVNSRVGTGTEKVN